MATLKIQSAEIEPFWATPKILLFLRMRFFNFVLTYMVQKYQNEISPIVYYGKKLKTSGKLLKIPDLQPRDWGQPYWMTRYNCIMYVWCWKSWRSLLPSKFKRNICWLIFGMGTQEITVMPTEPKPRALCPIWYLQYRPQIFFFSKL